MIVIQSYESGLTGVRSANADVKLHLERDPAMGDQPVLRVEYPAPGANPAGRDVWCDVAQTDWTSGRAIVFQVRPEHAPDCRCRSWIETGLRIRTGWICRVGAWQTVRIPLDQIRPNPYFQPPGANTGAPIDVSEVARLGFAPQDKSAGQLTIGGFVVE